MHDLWEFHLGLSSATVPLFWDPQGLTLHAVSQSLTGPWGRTTQKIWIPTLCSMASSPLVACSQIPTPSVALFSNLWLFSLARRPHCFVATFQHHGQECASRLKARANLASPSAFLLFQRSQYWAANGPLPANSCSVYFSSFLVVSSRRTNLIQLLFHVQKLEN